MTHEWTTHVSKSGKTWLIHNDSMDECVLTKPDTKGYLYVYHKTMGYATTIDEAKRCIEGMAD